jgi:uncharacterized protein YbaA (DUF1428 family)
LTAIVLRQARYGILSISSRNAEPHLGVTRPNNRSAATRRAFGSRGGWDEVRPELCHAGSEEEEEHGALEVVETVAEDVKPGKRTSFPRSVKLKRSETVVFSWVTFKSRKHRDRVMAKVMQDPRAQKLMNSEDMPGDGQRMFWGGFDVMFKV